MQGDDKPRKLTGGKALTAWFERTPEEQWAPVVDALFRICDHTWQELDWFADLTREHCFVIAVGADVWLVWRVIATYPNYFEVLYLGDPDDMAFHG